MRIKWKNITAILLVIFGLIVWVKAGPQIMEFLSAIPKVSPSGNPDDRIVGLMGFGLILITLICLARILVHRD